MTANRPPVLFLSWESPWPATYGGAVRALALLNELSRHCDVELMVLTRDPLTAEQQAVFGAMCCRVTRVALPGRSLSEKLAAAADSLRSGRPYHCSLLHRSFRAQPDVLQVIHRFPGVVFASYGHWGTLAEGESAARWVLDQQHVATHFWQVYRTQTRHPLVKAVAWINEQLARRHFSAVYKAVGRVIAVCDEDRELTIRLAPGSVVDVIANGVDCFHYTPGGPAEAGTPTALFIGTSERRNVTALRRFVRDVYPSVRRRCPSVRLVVAGAVDARVRARFSQNEAVTFTGPLDDLRDVIRDSDVVVIPHSETHGSQLKVAIAMAMGKAIVSTKEGIRGMPLVDGQSVLVAHDAAAFAAHTAALLADPAARRRLGEAARVAAASQLDWGVLGAHLVQIVTDVASRSVPLADVSQPAKVAALAV